MTTRYHDRAMSEKHRHGDPRSVRVAVVTVSDTRTEADDEGGRLLRERLTAAGHEVVDHRIVKDEPADVRAHVVALLDAGRAEAIVTTGGTGIAARDSTYEAIDGLLEKRLDGFGELFRMLSYAEVGAAAMLSRAVAGVARGAVIIALPGSVNAVELALTKLILPELAHMAKLAARARA
jgi:molybdenum cofactor biosynthesis protein B